MSFIQDAMNRMNDNAKLREKNRQSFKDRRGDYNVKSNTGYLNEAAKNTLKNESTVKIRIKKKQQESLMYLVIFAVVSIAVLWFLISY